MAGLEFGVVAVIFSFIGLRLIMTRFNIRSGNSLYPFVFILQLMLLNALAVGLLMINRC